MQGIGAISQRLGDSERPLLGRALRSDFAPLAVLLGVGAVLRLITSLIYSPSVLNQYDSAGYVIQAERGLFESFHLAPGYSFFLRIVNVISDSVIATITLQHLLGLVTAALLWEAVRHLTGSRWLGLVPAGVVALSGDFLFIEHAIATETVFTLLVVGAMCAGLRAHESERPYRWLLGAGLLLGLAIWVRFVAIALVAVLAIWALFVLWPRWRHALAGAAAVVAPAAALVALLVVLQGNATGKYALTEASGWGLYSRVAGFADCREFKPPRGTSVLCQSPSEARRNPDWYTWELRSPARKHFGDPPERDALIGEWARRALIAQPLDYAAEVLDDLSLFVVEEDWINRDHSLLGPRSISFALRAPDDRCGPDLCKPAFGGVETASLKAFTRSRQGGFYDPFTPEIGNGIYRLQQYQRYIRVHALLLGLLIGVSVLGLFAARGRLGAAQWLLVACGLSILLFATATSTYNIRYALPVMPLLAASATLSAFALRDPVRSLAERLSALVSRTRPALRDRG